MDARQTSKITQFRKTDEAIYDLQRWQTQYHCKILIMKHANSFFHSYPGEGLRSCHGKLQDETRVRSPKICFNGFRHQGCHYSASTEACKFEENHWLMHFCLSRSTVEDVTSPLACVFKQFCSTQEISRFKFWNG